MRVAFFSDVHANLEALYAVFSTAADCDEIYCGGDLVGYGDRPNEVVQEIRSRIIPTVIGNHDCFALGLLEYDSTRDDLYRASWTQSILDLDNVSWLEERPQQLLLNLSGINITLTHASPWDLVTYLFKDSPYLLRAMPSDGSTLVVGHSHHGFIVDGENGRIVNCGSVGFPRSGRPGAQYAVLDTHKNEWSLRTADYDVAGLAHRLETAGWKSEIVSRLKDQNSKS